MECIFYEYITEELSFYVYIRELTFYMYIAEERTFYVHITEELTVMYILQENFHFILKFVILLAELCQWEAILKIMDRCHSGTIDQHCLVLSWTEEQMYLSTLTPLYM
jgi:hypothetical protein